MPKHDAEVEAAMKRNLARSLLEAFEEGDRVEREGLRFWCHRMMTMCHRAAGRCECDDYDKRIKRER